MRIASGVVDQYIYFVAVDSGDFVTRETGLTTFTVYRSRNGGAPVAMTTPTINETDTTNMPGIYELLLDEDMTIDSGDDTQEMVFHITHAGMAPVTRTIELYRPKITVGNTLDVTATGAGGIDWGNIENKAAAVDLSGTDIQLCDTVTTCTTTTTNTDMRGTDNAATAVDLATVDTNVDAILVDTGTDGVVISAAIMNSIADALLDRDMSIGTDSGSPTVRTVRQALRFLRNKWSIAGTTLTVTKEDDTTQSWTSSVTTDAAADPITANDPA